VCLGASGDRPHVGARIPDRGILIGAVGWVAAWVAGLVRAMRRLHQGHTVRAHEATNQGEHLPRSVVDITRLGTDEGREDRRCEPLECAPASVRPTRRAFLLTRLRPQTLVLGTQRCTATLWHSPGYRGHYSDQG